MPELAGKHGIKALPGAWLDERLARNEVELANIIRIARDLGYEVRHEAMIRTDIYLADECFMTGTAAEVIPVASLDDRLVGSGEPGPITRELQSRYSHIVRGQVPGYDEWLTYCN